MDKFVLTTTERQRLLIDQGEYSALVSCLNKGDKFVVIQGHLISLAIAPAVSPFANWYATESERLANSGKRLCKKCLKQMEIQDKCPCWENMGKGAKQNAFKAPEEIGKLVSKYNWPELTKEDRHEIAKGEEKKSEVRMIEKNGMAGYIDENGEEIYS